MPAPLNKKETESLLHVEKTFDVVLRKGYNPREATEDDKNIGKILRNAKSVLGTIIAMKGNYPT